jgi:hypothetical protein
MGLATFSTSGIKKNAQVLSSGFTSGSNTGAGIGGGGTAKMVPEIYSPLWLTSNLNLPRDRATINAWCRAFFALNPFVHNAINLHSTYPISKLSIKCADKNVEKFFNDMIEETGLMNICVQVGMEYWLLGEAFVYGELDHHQGKWRRLLIQNPDYMVVNRTVVADEPIIMLRPDQNLKRIVSSNKPADMEQRKQLNQYIVDAVKRGQNIPLPNFNVSHLARKISPYEIRGTGLPVCIFRQLMLFDQLYEAKFAQAQNMINPTTIVKVGTDAPDGLHPTSADLEAWRDVFACHDEETEVLTEQGFKKFEDVIEYKEVMNGTNNSSYIQYAAPKEDLKIACFNPNTEELEYHKPSEAHLYNYDGDMYHFSNHKMDIKVTPNHKMWVSKKEYEYHGHRSLRTTQWGEWQKIEAQDINLNDYNRFRSEIKWTGKEADNIDVCGKKVPIELYLEFLGYVLSEGDLYTDNKHQYTVRISQSTPKYYKEMLRCIEKMATILDKGFGSSISKRSERTERNDLWTGTISGKEFFDFIKGEVCDIDGNSYAPNKKIPQWIFALAPRRLKVILDALVAGDGSIHKQKNSTGYSYYTTSKQLADGVYEIAYKCGYVPTMFIRTDREDSISLDGTITPRLPIYTIMWSDSNKGQFPLVYKTSRHSQTKEKHDLLTVEKYSGKVWCFTVPTGLFITRRNGRITIQGNSGQYDKDFKIFTHAGIAIERVGWGQGIYDIGPDITELVKQIYTGLMVPPTIMDGGADITYNNAGVALDVLRQRYMSFRNMLALWLKKKIFAPISEIQGFYERKEGKKELIIPDIEWNHMSLFDATDYVQNLVTLSTPAAEGQQARVSEHTLYKSLGLEWEDEKRKLRKEAIQQAIAQKETQALGTMGLNELRALTDEDEILEPTDGQGQAQEQPLPGESPGMGGGPGLGGGGPDLGLGGLPGLGPTPSTPTTPSTPPTTPTPAAPAPPAGAPPAPPAPPT